MKSVIKGEYKNGIVEIKEEVDFKEGTKVIIIPELESNIGIPELILQQQVVKKIWDDEREDIYGEV